MNAIRTIEPYQHSGMWVFDDASVGLCREPFVAGVPEVIDALVKDIPNAARGFRLLFSTEAFPGYQAHAEWLREEFGGNWYRWPKLGMEGWLCPALFKYFDKAPPKLFARVEAIEPSESIITVRRSQVEELLALLDAGDTQSARAMVAEVLG
jgi:hypothetical protein